MDRWCGVTGGPVRVLTIGHSNSPIADFVKLLKLHGVQTIVDVRSAPYSRFAPQFNRETLSAGLAQAAIDYRWAGESLGGRPNDPTCYRTGVLPEGKADYLELVNYAEVAQRDWFLRGIQRLTQLAQASVTAVLCSEEDPSRCHRHHLIARVLLRQDVEVQHIRGAGNLENAQETERTLVHRDNAEQLGLFDTRGIA
jgi:uncharacterized protein (DUF488 family)